MEQLNTMTAQTFRDETGPLLGRAEKRLLRNVKRSAGYESPLDAAKAIAALQQAKTNLDGALAMDPTGLDAAHIVDALQQALTEFRFAAGFLWRRGIFLICGQAKGKSLRC